MAGSASLLILVPVFVAAGLFLVEGVTALLRLAGRDRTLGGECLVLLAVILPEVLVLVHAMMSPGRLANHMGDPYLAVGATMASATATLLVAGAFAAARPRQGGLAESGAGGPLASVAVLLMIACASVIGLGVGAGRGISTAQLISGVVLILLLVLGISLVRRQDLKVELPPDLFRGGEGSIVTATAVAAASLAILTYTAPALVSAAIPLFQPEGAYANGRLFGTRLLIVGLVLAMPDALLVMRSAPDKGRQPAISSLVMSAAALVGLAAIAGLDTETLWDGYASSLLATLLATVFLAGVGTVLMLATSTPRSARWRGLILAAIVLVGMAFSVAVLRSA